MTQPGKYRASTLDGLQAHVRVWEGLKLPVEELQPRIIYFGVVVTVTWEQISIWAVTLGLPRERLFRID